MKKSLERNCCLFLMFLLFLFITGIFCDMAYAQEKTVTKESVKPVKEKKKDRVSLVQGYWRENATERLDYNMYYTVITYKWLRFRYDFMELDDADNFSRYWFYAGKFPLIKSKDVKITAWPCVHWDTKDRTYYGGDLILSFPKVGLSVVQRSISGENLGKHYTFADLKIAKSGEFTGLVSYYLLSTTKASPDAYLGPKVKFGKNIHVWYGFGVARSGSSLLNIQANIKF